MNILITAIGSMSAEAAIASFRQFENTRIIGCDIYPSLWLGTSGLVDGFYQIPRADASDYIDTLIEICRHHRIRYVVPLTDPEVDVLSDNRDRFEKAGIILCISNSSAIDISRDKMLLFKHFKDSGVVIPIPTFDQYEIVKADVGFPVIAKPKKGRSSEGIFRIHQPGWTERSHLDLTHYIFQPVIRGDIFTVDYVRDASGKDASVPRKELLRTTNGAGLTVETLKDNQLSELVSEIGRSLEILGCMNMEFIFDGGKYYLMDINPRFSAGVAFSKLSGYDMCKNHLYAFMNKELDEMGAGEYGIYIKKYTEIKIL